VRLPAGAEARLGRQLETVTAELERSVSPMLASELRRLVGHDTVSPTLAELRVGYAGVLGWTGGLVIAMLDQLATAPARPADQSTAPSLLPAWQAQARVPAGPRAGLPRRSARPRPGPHPGQPPGSTRHRGADPRRLQRRLRSARVRILASAGASREGTKTGAHPAGRGWAAPSTSWCGPGGPGSKASPSAATASSGVWRASAYDLRRSTARSAGGRGSRAGAALGCSDAATGRVRARAHGEFAPSAGTKVPHVRDLRP